MPEGRIRSTPRKSRARVGKGLLRMYPPKGKKISGLCRRGISDPLPAALPELLKTERKHRQGEKEHGDGPGKEKTPFALGH